MSEPRHRLQVNQILCDGVGYCSEIVPELISLDDWGYPIVSPDAVDDPSLRRLVARAVAQCPRVALTLTRQKERER